MIVIRYKLKEKDYINMLLNFFEVYVKIELLNIYCGFINMYLRLILCRFFCE